MRINTSSYLHSRTAPSILVLLGSTKHASDLIGLDIHHNYAEELGPRTDCIRPQTTLLLRADAHRYEAYALPSWSLLTFTVVRCAYNQNISQITRYADLYPGNITTYLSRNSEDFHKEIALDHGSVVRLTGPLGVSSFGARMVYVLLRERPYRNQFSTSQTPKHYTRFSSRMSLSFRSRRNSWRTSCAIDLETHMIV